MATTMSVDNFNGIQLGRVGMVVADNFNTPDLVALTPNPPINFEAEPYSTGALITWEAPTPKLGVTISGYRVTATGPDYVLNYSIAADAVEALLTNLVNGETWELSMVAYAASFDSSAVTASVSPSGSDPEIEEGDGRIVSPSVVPPTAPVLDLVTPSDGTALLAWTPAFDGGSPVLDWTLRAEDATGENPTVTVVVEADAVEGVIGPLVNDVEYTFSMKTRNALAESLYSNELTETPEAGLPPVGPIIVPPEPPPFTIPQPAVYAFPASFLFRPGNFGLTPEQAAAEESVDA